MDTQSLNKGESLELVLTNESAVHRHFVQQEGSRLRLFLVNLSTPVDADITIEQLGPHCVSEVYALCLGRGDENSRIATHMRHLATDGESRQLIKFVLQDKAKGEFLGELLIAKDSQRVDATQTNRNLLLSPTADMRTRPQLEIYADDVKAGHGASTGQLDEQAVFYMQQRCIGYNDARRMLIAAFLKDVLAEMTDSRQQEQLLNAIDSVIEQVQ